MAIMITDMSALIAGLASQNVRIPPSMKEVWNGLGLVELL